MHYETGGGGGIFRDTLIIDCCYYRLSNDRGGRSVNGSDYKWNTRTQEGHRPHPLVDGGLPTLAKPGDSLLSVWTNRKRVAADGCH